MSTDDVEIIDGDDLPPIEEEPTVNNTDYEFPPNWWTFTDEQKCEWFMEERSRRQAARQGTYRNPEKTGR